MNVQQILAGYDRVVAENKHLDLFGNLTAEFRINGRWRYYIVITSGKERGNVVIRADDGFHPVDASTLPEPGGIHLTTVRRAGDTSLFAGINIITDADFSKFRIEGPRSWDGKPSKWENSLAAAFFAERQLRDDAPPINISEGTGVY